jgi:hypothetical protein
MKILSINYSIMLIEDIFIKIIESHVKVKKLDRLKLFFLFFLFHLIPKFIQINNVIELN